MSAAADRCAAVSSPPVCRSRAARMSTVTMPAVAKWSAPYAAPVPEAVAGAAGEAAPAADRVPDGGRARPVQHHPGRGQGEHQQQGGAPDPAPASAPRGAGPSGRGHAGDPGPGVPDPAEAGVSTV
ncbi:hypothetical protein [Kitasatospora sp. NPDC059571]|uniref:hypothetical protein n=1 Tax=Kitasatospora sp. NPDC059571 TaxID=3346871 RepID=UPI00369A973F